MAAPETKIDGPTIVYCDCRKDLVPVVLHTSIDPHYKVGQCKKCNKIITRKEEK